MKITKKNGTISMYDDEKVVKSILNANADIPGESISPAVAEAFANAVFNRLTSRFSVITTADVRECVIDLLQEKGYVGTAACYRDYLK